MIMDLMGHKDYIRILLTLRKKGGLRFGQIEDSLGLNPAQVDRALKFLSQGLWINAHRLSAEKGRSQLEYSLGKRGAEFLEVFANFTADIYRRKDALGPAEVKEFRDLYPQAASAGQKSIAGRIDRVIKIGPLHQDEKETLASYRGGCLKLSPGERIAEMREHSRRMILLNPKNPRSPHIDRRSIRITHDAI